MGFGCNLSNFTTYTGDVAISNDQGNTGGANGGLTLNSCYETSILGPVTPDPTTSPTQVNGVLNSGSMNTSIVGCPTGNGSSGLPLSDSAGNVGTYFNNCGKPLGFLNSAGLTANLSATTLYTTLSSLWGWGGSGLYRVCAALWPTATGNSTVTANAVAPSGAGTVTVPIGSSLNTAALTNGGGGCIDVQAASSSAIQVSVTGYNTTGTYSVKATVSPVILN